MQLQFAAYRHHPSRPTALQKWRLKRVVDYVDAHLADPIRLPNLAAAAGLSPMYFAAQFRIAMGVRPQHYVLKRRIDRACELLRNSELALVEVALSVGFQAQAHFTTVFRRFVGQTPYRWRRLSADAGNRGSETVDDGVTVDWLAEKADGSCRFGAPADTVYAEGRDEDHRDAQAAGLQLRLQIQPAHAQHLDIDDQAGCVVEVRRGQERLGRGEHAGFVAERADKAAHRGTNRFVIVDNRDDS
jgi:AraC-like DNA-binding protein